MTFEDIVVETPGNGVATLIFNRPERLNVLSIRMRTEIARAVAALEADASVRVLILTGTGRAFTAGLDLDEWSADGHVAAGAYEHDVVATLQSFGGPVIAAVNGLAITGGLEISLACDLVVASADAVFIDSHAKVGLLPGWGGSVRLARRIGLHRAKELALTGRPLGAHEAADWGLVNHVVPAEALRSKAESLATQMLACVPATLSGYLNLLDEQDRMSLPDALAFERRRSIENNRVVSREDIEARLAALRRQPK